MPSPRQKKTEAAIANLERTGDKLKVYSLQTLLTNKRNRATRDAAKLGDVLLPWYEKTVSKPAAKMEGMVEIWQEHVPANIVSRSRLIGFERGTLRVSLESSTARAELDARLRAGLLRILQAATKNAIFRVKTSVQSGSAET